MQNRVRFAQKMTEKMPEIEIDSKSFICTAAYLVPCLSLNSPLHLPGNQIDLLSASYCHQVPGDSNTENRQK